MKNVDPTLMMGVARESRQHLYSLAATHPRFGRISWTTTQHGNGKQNVEALLCLFNNRSDRTLLFQVQWQSLNMLGSTASHSMEQRRAATQKMMQIPKSIDQFDFALPSDVGVCHGPSSVFLSDLHGLNEGSPFSKGRFTRESGFDAHPFHGGTGDHINTIHDHDICLQFVHLLQKNASELSEHQNVDAEFGKIVNPHRSLAVYEANLKFVRFLELGVFMVRLRSLRIIRIGAEDGDIAVRSFKVPFAFEVEMAIEQCQRQCVLSSVKVCPVFMSSLL